MVEHYPYPIASQRYGFNLSSIFSQKGTGEVLSESGNMIGWEIGRNSIRLDNYFRERFFSLAADIDDGIVSFDLVTRIGRLPPIRHPDFYAGAFVGCALNYFENSGHIIKGLSGSWFAESRNYREFYRYLKRTSDEHLSARSTWTGKTYAKYGFSKIANLEYIEKPRRIDVLFVR